MLEQISTSRDGYTLTEQSYTPTKQSIETFNAIKFKLIHSKLTVCFLCTIHVANGAFHTANV